MAASLERQKERDEAHARDQKLLILGMACQLLGVASMMIGAPWCLVRSRVASARAS